MIKFLRRLFAGAAPESNAEMLRSGERSRGTIIDDRQPVIPGVIRVATADVITQIFRADIARQEAQFSRSAHGGAISFNSPRRK